MKGESLLLSATIKLGGVDFNCKCIHQDGFGILFHSFRNETC